MFSSTSVYAFFKKISSNKTVLDIASHLSDETVFCCGGSFSSIDTPKPSSYHEEIPSESTKSTVPFLNDVLLPKWNAFVIYCCWLFLFCYRSSFSPISSSSTPRSQSSTLASQDGASAPNTPKHGACCSSNGVNYTSDVGWGCMHRTTQMLLAHALVFLHLGPIWESKQSFISQKYYHIVRWFADEYSSPLSIHSIVREGESMGYPAGEWLRPTPACFAAKRALDHPSARAGAVGLRAHVATDRMIAREEILKVATHANALSSMDGSPRGGWEPLLLLLPLRLGIDSVHPKYWRVLATFFRTQGCVGVIGGKPKSSLFFFGLQGEQLLFLDPHTVRPALTTDEILGAENNASFVESIHGSLPGTIPISSIDPSLAVGFLCRTYHHCVRLLSSLQNILVDDQPFFSVVDSLPDIEIDFTPSSPTPSRSYSDPSLTVCPPVLARRSDSASIETPSSPKKPQRKGRGKWRGRAKGKANEKMVDGADSDEWELVD
eukprot:GCRY01001871.1.p1 GENE.GCRY01001871.1~~GCRY01001871.1.p1  ORF type:complete len:491 (-),score=94.10 GCRY01001871.1:478-1950(-)